MASPTHADRAAEERAIVRVLARHAPVIEGNYGAVCALCFARFTAPGARHDGDCPYLRARRLVYGKRGRR